MFVDGWKTHDSANLALKEFLKGLVTWACVRFATFTISDTP